MLILVTAVMSGVASGYQTATLITGDIKWTDDAGHTHAARTLRFGVVEENSILGSLFHGVYSAGVDGSFSVPITFHTGATGFSINYFAVNDAADVSPTASPFVQYTIPGTFHFGIAPTGPLSLTIGNTTSGERSIGLMDALYSTYYFARAARSAPGVPAPPPKQNVVFPDPGGEAINDGAFVRIPTLNAQEWDVINHEHSHSLSQLDHLDHIPTAPLLAHDPGDNNIVRYDKDRGPRLGWAEGLATWMGVAAQNFDTAGQHLPTGLATVGDTIDTASITDPSGTITTSINLETRTGDDAGAAFNKGESDENAVMRILWDLGDAANEPKDRVSMGHDGVYRTLRDIAAAAPTIPVGRIERLNDVWNHLSTHATSIEQRTNYGAIFEENGVSPVPVPLTTSFGPAVAPTLTWAKGNDGGNETFILRIFKFDLTSEIMSIPIPGTDATSFTLSAANWATLISRGEGEFKYVLEGWDKFDPSGAMYAAAQQTGGYWSDRYSIFVTIPAPGTFGLALTAMVFSRPRRVRCA